MLLDRVYTLEMQLGASQKALAESSSSNSSSSSSSYSAAVGRNERGGS
jgi:hypothetical protein